MLDGLQIDRTSCSRFWANQLRVRLTAAAYAVRPEPGRRRDQDSGGSFPGVDLSHASSLVDALGDAEPAA